MHRRETDHDPVLASPLRTVFCWLRPSRPHQRFLRNCCKTQTATATRQSRGNSPWTLGARIGMREKLDIYSTNLGVIRSAGRAPRRVRRADDCLREHTVWPVSATIRRMRAMGTFEGPRDSTKVSFATTSFGDNLRSWSKQETVLW